MRRPASVTMDTGIETAEKKLYSHALARKAAIRIVNHQLSDQISILIRADRKIPPEISHMTGITDEMVRQEGVSFWKAMEKLRDFIGSSPIVSHNVSFDRAFISEASMRLGEPPLRNICKDTLALAKRRIDDIRDYKLETIAEYYHIEVTQKHRALADCITTFQIYEKLNEI